MFVAYKTPRSGGEVQTGIHSAALLTVIIHSAGSVIDVEVNHTGELRTFPTRKEAERWLGESLGITSDDKPPFNPRLRSGEVTMDPNETLTEIRRLCSLDMSKDEANRLSDLISGLDNWLSNGGFLPKDWERVTP